MNPTFAQVKELGISLAVGDKLAPSLNTDWHVQDDDRVSEFTDRENTGKQPVEDGVLVQVKFKDGKEEDGHLASDYNWDLNIVPSIESWKPSLINWSI